MHGPDSDLHTLTEQSSRSLASDDECRENEILGRISSQGFRDGVGIRSKTPSFLIAARALIFPLEVVSVRYEV